MINSAPFQAADEKIQERRTYNPVPIPPRGEIVAWFFTFVLGSLTGLLVWRAGPTPFWAPLFSILALLLALSIRFSRWLEANTSIIVRPNGIDFSSPIRKCSLRWHEVIRLTADSAGNGWRINVFGESGSFRFQTLTIMQGMRGTEARTGVPNGDQIVRQVLRMAGLEAAEVDGASWSWQRS